MKIEIRQEKPSDYPAVFNLIKAAFRHDEISNHNEHYLVEKLRKSKDFIPALSLVAISNNEIVGHVLMTKITIKNKTNSFISLALAPISVKPEYQQQGIGKQLMLAAHNKAKEFGFNSIVILGHEDYYPKFGYKPMSNYKITMPFEAPEKNCFVIALTKDALRDVTGMVQYPTVFFE